MRLESNLPLNTFIGAVSIKPIRKKLEPKTKIQSTSLTEKYLSV